VYYVRVLFNAWSEFSNYTGTLKLSIELMAPKSQAQQLARYQHLG